MASVTVTIPDDQLTRVSDAAGYTTNYSGTREEFLREFFIGTLEDYVVNKEGKEKIADLRKDVDTNITLS